MQPGSLSSFLQEEILCKVSCAGRRDIVDIRGVVSRRAREVRIPVEGMPRRVRASQTRAHKHAPEPGETSGGQMAAADPVTVGN